jgi:topoisomerase-4 subunit A
VLPDQCKFVIFAGKRSFRMTYNIVSEFSGNRGGRGKKLPRGFQGVSRIAVEEG